MTVHYSLRLSIYLNFAGFIQRGANEREIGDRLSLFVAADHLALDVLLNPLAVRLKIVGRRLHVLHRSLAHCNSFAFSQNI